MKVKKGPVNQHHVAATRKYDIEFQPSLDKNHVVNNNESGGEKNKKYLQKIFLITLFMKELNK